MPRNHELRTGKLLLTCNHEVMYSNRGYPNWICDLIMPRIDDEILDCVIYLYFSTDDAEKSEPAGGSGFLVSVPSEVHEGISYIYAVTNSHIILNDALSLRLNTQQLGQIRLIETRKNNWVHHQDGDDLAIHHFGPLLPNWFRYRTIPLSMFLTKDIISQFDIGLGDDVFMVGRYINHEGKQSNLPSLRYGHISMMPWEPVQGAMGQLQDSFLMDLRSRSGYSGSPMFLDSLPDSRREMMRGEDHRYGPWLLGIQWGMTSDGVSAVVPAWKLHELLYTEEMVEKRKKSDESISNDKSQQGFVPSLAQDNDEALTREEFMKALRKVSRPLGDQPDSEKSET